MTIVSFSEQHVVVIDSEGHRYDLYAKVGESFNEDILRDIVEEEE